MELVNNFAVIPVFCSKTLRDIINKQLNYVQGEIKNPLSTDSAVIHLELKQDPPLNYPILRTRHNAGKITTDMHIHVTPV